MRKIKVGQIGLGHNHGEGKMLAIRKFPELFEVVGFSESDQKWIATRSHLECYRDLPRISEDELIEKCELIIIECDIWNLTATAMKCIKAGKHVHIDKPASGTLEEYREMLELRRNHADFQFVKADAPKQKTANKAKNLTYDNMELFIRNSFDSEKSKSLLEELSRVKALSRIQANPYKYVHDWFLKQCPNYNSVEVANNSEEENATEKASA